MGEASLDPTVAALKPLHEPQKELFDKIDGLRGLGVGRIVDLPQIIVVGDQSSGKSSVLEAISRVRFPVDGGLCTRFATELVLRNTKKPNIAVSIDWETDPAEALAKDAQDKLGSFNTKEELKEIVNVAKQLMGIRKGKGFSKDVLRIKISDPDVPDLTLVDLPGFYHAENETQTADDRSIVNELVLKYMRQRNGIILAVVSAKSDPVMQKVLSEARKPDIDPKLERTLGVVTQPDRLEPGTSSEETYLTLVENRNKSYYLKHEWHVLKNRSETERDWSDDRRDAAETEFLSSGSWRGFPWRNKGVESLRTKLGSMLYDHIAGSLPAVIETMESSVAERQRKLDNLGQPRSTAKEMRVYLTGIGERFKGLAGHAITGNYLDNFFRDSLGPREGANIEERSVRRLRALVRDMNRAFVASIHLKGAAKTIKWEDGAKDEVNVWGDVPDYLQPLMEKHYRFDDSAEIPESEFKADAEKLASEFQGLEFPGEPNHMVTLSLFQRQARPWKGISNRHVDLVTETARQFVRELLDHIIDADLETRDRIIHGFVQPFFQEKKTALQEKLDELLPTSDDAGFALPLEWEFQQHSKVRFHTRLDNQVTELEQQGRLELAGEKGDLIRSNSNFLQVWVSERRPASKFGIERVIDHMITYYQLSLRTFTENVITLAIEKQLIRDIPEIFTAQKVAGMSEARLKELAAESPAVEKERRTLENEIASLKEGLDLCQSYRHRDQLVL